VLPGSAIGGGPFATGTDPVFSLGDLTNNDRDANKEFAVLEFNALVDNSVVAKIGMVEFQGATLVPEGAANFMAQGGTTRPATNSLGHMIWVMFSRDSFLPKPSPRSDLFEPTAILPDRKSS